MYVVNINFNNSWSVNSNPIWGNKGTGAYPSSQQERGRVHSEQETSETGNT